MHAVSLNSTGSYWGMSSTLHLTAIYPMSLKTRLDCLINKNIDKKIWQCPSLIRVDRFVAFVKAGQPWQLMKGQNNPMYSARCQTIIKCKKSQQTLAFHLLSCIDEVWQKSEEGGWCSLMQHYHPRWTELPALTCLIRQHPPISCKYLLLIRICNAFVCIS